MKKLLAILLALVLYIGVFVSCDNNEETSSSESSEESFRDKEEGYYKTVPLTYVLSDESVAPSYKIKQGAPNFKFYTDYNSLLNDLQEPINGFDESIFNDNYILMVHDVYVPVAYFNVIGFKNMILGFKYDYKEDDSFAEHKAFLELDVEIQSEGTDDTKYISRLIIIPKSEFLGRDDLEIYTDNVEIILVKK